MLRRRRGRLEVVAGDGSERRLGRGHGDGARRLLALRPERGAAAQAVGAHVGVGRSRNFWIMGGE